SFVPRTEGTKLQDLLVLVVEAGEPGGEALDRRLELRVQVDEVAQPLGQPLQAHRLLAAPLRQLLDTAVGEVHAQLRGSAASMRAACSASCSFVEPTAGAAADGREIRRSHTPSRGSRRLSAMNDQAPRFAGSSWIQG